MRLYLAGNFTVTDRVESELELKERLGDDYNRLCTYFYPKPADVIIKNILRTDITKKIKMNKKDLKTKNHPMAKLKKIKEDKDESKIKKEEGNKESRKENKKILKSKKRKIIRKRT